MIVTEKLVMPEEIRSLHPKWAPKQPEQKKPEKTSLERLLDAKDQERK